jgi:WD40 repeat protein
MSSGRTHARSRWIAAGVALATLSAGQNPLPTRWHLTGAATYSNPEHTLQMVGDLISVDRGGPIAILERATGRVRWRIPTTTFGSEVRHAITATPPRLARQWRGSGGETGIALFDLVSGGQVAYIGVPHLSVIAARDQGSFFVQEQSRTVRRSSTDFQVLSSVTTSGSWRLIDVTSDGEAGLFAQSNSVIDVNLSTGAVIREYTGIGTSGGYTPDGQAVLISLIGTHLVTLYRRSDGVLLQQASLSSPSKVSVSPTGTHALVVSDSTRLALLSLPSLEVIALLPVSGSLARAHWWPDASRFVVQLSNNGGTLWEYRTADVARVRRLHGLSTHSATVAFSPSGGHVVATGSNSVYEVFTAAEGAYRYPVPVGVVANSMTFADSPDWLIVGDTSGWVREWNINGFPGPQFDARGGRIHFAASRLATLGQEINVWQRPAYSNVGRYYVAGGTSVALSPDGTKLAVGTSSGLIFIVSVSTGAYLHALAAHSASVGALAWSADGQRLYSGSQDSTLRAWSTATGQLLLTGLGHTSGLTSIALCRADQTLLSASYDGTVRAWRASDLALQSVYAGNYSNIMELKTDGQSAIAFVTEDGDVGVAELPSGLLKRYPPPLVSD